MKIFYSIDSSANNVNFINDNGTVFAKWNNESSEKSSLGFSKNEIQKFLQNANRSLTEANIVYITIDNDGNLDQPIFKTIETNQTKLGGLEYITLKLNKKTVGQIYIPFEDSSDEEYAIRINLKEEDVSKLLEFSQDAIKVEPTNEEFKKIHESLLPKLKVINTSKSENWTKIKVQLTLNGNDVSKEGVRIFAKSSSGYIANREVYTNENGIAEFKVTPYGLEQGESMKAEFGFKYYSNVVSKDVVA
jgi:hypothetical protein